MDKRIQIEPAAFFLTALWLLVLPVRWLAGAAVAMAVHEAAHYLMIRLLGGRVYCLTVGMTGAKMETGPMEPRMQLLSALAGPAGSFLLLLLGECFPEAALWGLAQGMYNLLPVYPLDGGRVVRSLASEKFSAAAEAFTLVLLWGLGVWLWAESSLGLLPLFPAAALSAVVISRNIACKAGKQAVQ